MGMDDGDRKEERGSAYNNEWGSGYLCECVSDCEACGSNGCECDYPCTQRFHALGGKEARCNGDGTGESIHANMALHVGVCDEVVTPTSSPPSPPRISSVCIRADRGSAEVVWAAHGDGVCKNEGPDAGDTEEARDGTDSIEWGSGYLCECVSDCEACASDDCKCDYSCKHGALASGDDVTYINEDGTQDGAPSKISTHIRKAGGTSPVSGMPLAVTDDDRQLRVLIDQVAPFQQPGCIRVVDIDCPTLSSASSSPSLPSSPLPSEDQPGTSTAVGRYNNGGHEMDSNHSSDAEDVVEGEGNAITMSAVSPPSAAHQPTVTVTTADWIALRTALDRSLRKIKALEATLTVVE